VVRVRVAHILAEPHVVAEAIDQPKDSGHGRRRPVRIPAGQVLQGKLETQARGLFGEPLQSAARTRQARSNIFRRVRGIVRTLGVRVADHHLGADRCRLLQTAYARLHCRLAQLRVEIGDVPRRAGDVHAQRREAQAVQLAP